MLGGVTRSFGYNCLTPHPLLRGSDKVAALPVVAQLKASVWWAVFLMTLLAPSTHADDAKALFEQSSGAVLQILMIDSDSEKKSSIGSGFRFGDLIATNFHVVSQGVHEPEQYRVEYIDAAGDRGRLNVVHFDVVHDLALLAYEAATAPAAHHTLQQSDRALTKGEGLFSLGNPYDLGQTIVPGTFNGLLETSFYQKLLFSGSLNPGMSGGPALDEDGRVIGVNVATAGNQISFLVPVKYLIDLVALHASTGALDQADYQQEIERQLVADQAFKYDLLLNHEWPTQTLGEMTVGGEISSYFKCWGNTREAGENDALHTSIDSNCSSQDNIFISGRFQTGAIDYQYTWLESEELNNFRMASLLGDSASHMYTRNIATEEDVTNYQCSQEFVGADRQPEGQWRKVLCVRQYKSYPSLFDVLYLGVLLGGGDSGLSSHFALSGVTMDNALNFLDRFMGLQKWRS